MAETVCLVSLILGFRFCVSGLRLSFFGSGIALGVAWWWWVDDKVEYATSPVTYFKLSRAFTPFFPGPPNRIPRILAWLHASGNR